MKKIREDFINFGYDFIPIDSMEVAQQLFIECISRGNVSYDIETTGLEHKPETVVRTIAFCTGYPNKKYVHIVGDYKLQTEDVNIDDEADAFIQNKKQRKKVTNFLVKNILNNEQIGKIGWNLKFDNAHIERVFGYKVRGKTIDGFLIKKLLNPIDKKAGLKDTTIQMLDDSYHNYEDKVLEHLGKRRKTKESVGQLFKEIPVKELCEYNGVDTEAALILTNKLYNYLKQTPSLERLYNIIVSNLSDVLTDIELKGLLIDVDRADIYIKNLEKECGEIEQSIQDNPKIKEYKRKLRVEALETFDDEYGDLIKEYIDIWKQGRNDKKKTKEFNKAVREINRLHKKRRKEIKPLNVSSPSQLLALFTYLFELDKYTLQEQGIELPDNELKTDVATIKKLPFENTACPDLGTKILRIRGIEKAVSTYLKVLRDNSVKNKNGDYRIHGTFRIGGTETGRLSSANPNLQNIPRAGSDTGTMIKECIIAPKGYKLLQIDFSQMELRMLALCSFDKTMLNIYADGEDLHKFAAMSILGVDEVGWNNIEKSEKKKARTMAKAVNFGFMYGMSPKKFMLYAENSYGIKFTEEEAKKLQTKFFTSFPSLVRYYVQLKQMVYDYIKEYHMIPYVFNLFGRMRPLLGVSYDRLQSLNINDKNSYIASACRNAINTMIQSSCADLMMLFMIQLYERIEEMNQRIENKIEIVNTVHDSVILYVPDKYMPTIYKLAKTLVQNPSWAEDFGIPFDTDIIFEIDFEYGDNWAKLKEYNGEII